LINFTKMKQFIFTFCMFYVLYAAAQEKNPVTGQVIDLMKEQEAAWNKADIRGFMHHYWNSDSLKFIGGKGVTYGWQKTLDNYLRSYPSKEMMGELSFTILEATALSGEAVYVVGKWDLKKDKPAGGYFTLLWRKKEGRWVIVSDHTS
jgi:ketosteroid isomerase-like protein